MFLSHEFYVLYTLGGGGQLPIHRPGGSDPWLAPALRVGGQSLATGLNPGWHRHHLGVP